MSTSEGASSTDTRSTLFIADQHMENQAQEPQKRSQVKFACRISTLPSQLQKSL
jgi:hypothetical protein